MDSFFKKIETGVSSLFDDDDKKADAQNKPSQNKPSKNSGTGHEQKHHFGHSQPANNNRYQSFAPESSGRAKWHVDGASYFWAVSLAIEQAKESIFILDWWLSPEVYLRRPPSKNERYRLDNMLKAAAERGVKVNIIVYKEVEAALTLNSQHTRRALEKLHPNIGVFRHPDHTPTGYDLRQELGSTFSHLTNFDLFKASGNAIKAIYGTTDGMVLFWAHHEKLLVVDRKVGFMGGLDLCFGRYDTNSHPIADAHPGDLDAIVFPGQDYNNARVFDFADVGKWDQNKLDRTQSSRMGWSDVALSMDGPIVEDMVDHFVDRWNFIWDEKYKNKDGPKYKALRTGPPGTDGAEENYMDHMANKLSRGMNHLMMNDDDNERGQHSDQGRRPGSRDSRYPKIQLTRSACEWSSGHKKEHSIQNAYIEAIKSAEHFIYIENQFFITATSDKQKPVANKLGGVIVDRIIRAHREGAVFKVWVVMPAVPAFAGDLHADSALGTRAIMEFQYNSISRGGNSIIQKLQQAGIQDPSQYIGFFNLRNYDRINKSRTMDDAERRANISYEDARRQHDDQVGSGYYPQGERTDDRSDGYQRYQREAAKVSDKTLDTVSGSYMLNGQNIAETRWDGEPDDEINAFVSEELYVHTKLLIADDRLVICGSANLNDRSQLGDHDSEIAVVIEDPTPLDTQMNGRPYRASAFAASLRRHIFRKHLGLLPNQPWDRPDQNWEPVDRSPNHYDWNSRADQMVADPLSQDFLRLWYSTSRTNTEVFSRAFHPVPNDHVRTWNDYKNFFSKYFIIPGAVKKEGEDNRGKVPYGHVVREEFPGGARELKQWLSRIRGNLVEMPLDFLVDVDDIAKEGLELNPVTQLLYT